VLRRAEELAERLDTPDLPATDPIEDATVLVAGRGRGYPALTVAVGERMGLIGALSIETARSYLGARDIDGVVIGDGFNRSTVEDFMEELCADPRRSEERRVGKECRPRRATERKKKNSHHADGRFSTRDLIG